MPSRSEIRPGRMPPEVHPQAFADLHPPLDGHEVRVAADRCLFCYDAPCVSACPTGIDIPMFIRQLATGQPLVAARTILDANIMGGMCARVCPTETLCEEACVRNAAEGKPVEIGRLQRAATDAMLETGRQPFRRGAPTGRRVAVVGAGPAGLACAHKLAVLGHAVVVFEARAKAGGLNEYGIAAYKATDDIARREVEWILGIGGIELRTGARLGRDVTLAGLREEFDAVFLGLGLGATNALGLDEGGLAGVEDALAFIERLRQAYDLSGLPVGRRVVVIGGGMTAIDAAVQARKLGAEEVTIVYRRGPEAMGASRYEQELAQTAGCTIRHWARPAALSGEGGVLAAVTFAVTQLADGRLVDTGETFTLAADQLLKAIGQTFVAGDVREAGGLLDMAGGRIVVDAERRTSLPGVWAGGDCVAGGRDLTVVAVEDGKRAALSIDRTLRAAMREAAE
ncbi:NAD(P)-dependent oxidoreductase [Chelatococcus sp. SYSU_G07232]|uniref:NAD(P)-dependent oxidoreductase n=1 Tax=Chelatococcus albus TaxID=3047466 RepID=A0ABT7AL82_9HYPH|nr:NAD(P)-dependent oxidoreductase [Chelatococcus sp. SYSU_G07232]MDJ1159356.1 NAD(P)-dependent oxidoreductase [Chelatococcus sp. SYSU_G07232]